MKTSTSVTELRVEIARRWDQPLYKLASAASIHPCTFSCILHGRLPLTEEIEARVLAVLRDQGEAVAK